MTKTIVVPLDGSALGEQALAPAAWVARGLRADLELITTTWAEDTEPQQQYLEDQARSMGLGDVHTELVARRFASDGIGELVASVPDPALVMTTKGLGGWAVALLGSVADEVVREVDAPVLLVGPHCHSGEPATNKVLLSTDGSDASAAVYPVVADWARHLDLDVHVVTVAQCGASRPADSRALAAQQVVEDTSRRLRDLGVDSTLHVLDDAYPAAAILALAQELGAGVIAIGTHGASGWSTQPLGSVASALVHYAHCPVLVRRLAR